MGKTRKVAILLLAVFSFTVLLTGCSFFSPKVGILDVNRVMNESPQIKGYQDQLNAKGKELSDQMEKEKPNLSAEDYQKRQEDAYGEFMKTKQDMESQIESSIKQILEQVSKDQGLGVVLYKNGVAAGGVDVTDEVIKRLQ
mgnify:CR=1 FL=1